MTDLLEQASFVASQYEVVRRILGNLPESTLVACEKVNQLWADAVKAERNSAGRKVIQMFTWKGKAQSGKVMALFIYFFTIYVPFFAYSIILSSVLKSLIITKSCTKIWPIGGKSFTRYLKLR